jgi:hypothetical protein
MCLPPSPFLVVDATKDKVTFLEVALVATHFFITCLPSTRIYGTHVLSQEFDGLPPSPPQVPHKLSLHYKFPLNFFITR